MNCTLAKYLIKNKKEQRIFVKHVTNALFVTLLCGNFFLGDLTNVTNAFGDNIIIKS